MGLISLLISIAMIYAMYYIFENYDLQKAIIVNCVYGIIISIINNGFNILALLLGSVVMIVETLILYNIYNKSNSFGDFFKKILIIGIVIAVIVLILGLISSSFISSSGLLK